MQYSAVECCASGDKLGAGLDREGQIVKLVAALVGVALAASTVQTMARWSYRSGSDAFSGPTLHIAAESNDLYTIGIRCRAREAEIRYITFDNSLTSDMVEKANALSPLLLVRIDKQRIQKLDARFTADSDGLIAFASVDRDLLAAMRNAKSRIAVAILAGGEHMHESDFSVSGSTAAIGRLMSGCGLD